MEFMVVWTSAAAMSNTLFLDILCNDVLSSVIIGDGSRVEMVDDFCYLVDMLPVDGDADAAVTTRICSGCFKFRSLAFFLTAKDVSLLLQGKVYDAIAGVRSCLLHGSETLSLKRENELAMHQAEMRMIG